MIFIFLRKNWFYHRFIMTTHVTFIFDYFYEYHGLRSTWRPWSFHLRLLVFSCHLLDSVLFIYQPNFKVPGMLRFPESKIIISNLYLPLQTDEEHHSIVIHYMLLKFDRYHARSLAGFHLPCKFAHFKIHGVSSVLPRCPRSWRQFNSGL